LGGEGGGSGVREVGGGKGGEMTQTLYAHMNKRKKIEKWIEDMISNKQVTEHSLISECI
jgi:hypothetical protein